MDRLEIRRPDDFHVHLRESYLLKDVIGFTAKTFGRALVMPNLRKPVLTAADLRLYRKDVLWASMPIDNRFEPLMTIKLTEATTIQDVWDAAAEGAVAVKAYPAGVTTNSADGVRDFHDQRVLDAIEMVRQTDLALCLHGEAPAPVFCLDREERFLETLEFLTAKFPGLRIVLEHVTTRAGVEAVRKLPAEVAATVTVHHLALTLDDMVGDLIRPHYFCKPLPKRPKDREALWEAVIGASPKFFLGTDSAPHRAWDKLSAAGCAGVFTAPVALPLLATLFEKRGCLDRLEDFVSRFGAEFYRLPLNAGRVALVREPWTVPTNLGSSRSLIPFMAGETLPWRLE